MARSSRLALLAGFAFIFAACGGAPATTVRPGTSVAPGVGTPAPAVPTPPGGGVSTGNECAAIPTFSIENPNPSFPTDAELMARFPASIDGSAPSDLNAVPFGALLCLGGQAGYDRAVAGLPAGQNWATVGFGSATYTVGGEETQLFAFRTPGSDARNVIDALMQLAATSGQQFEGTMTQGSLGGKNALIFTEPDGTVTYGYATGDTLYFLAEGTTEAQAATILAALP